MTPAQAAARLNRIADRLSRECVKALQLSANQGALLGKDLSRGGYSLAQLAEMGHPYALRHAATARAMGMSRKQYAVRAWGMNTIASAYIINKQTGEFANAWTTRAPSSAFNGTLRAATVNNSPVAGFLAGKHRPQSRMIRRPIDTKVAELLQPIAVENVRDAVRRALRTK